MTPRRLILGTAGHIDHGKTALVRALTGVDTDRLPQEKERGITIDIGFAELDLGSYDLGIVDVPGHERFIRNMLAGASGIDLALLVVAADDAVMPQTREHLAILRLLGIRHGLIALTKCDLADETWLELVEDEVRTLIQGTFLESAPIVRTSASRGEGMEELRQAMTEVCDHIEAESEGDPFRLAVDRSFVGQGVGTIVTGSVASGSLSAGGQVQWMPSGKMIRVRGLQSHWRETETVSRGQRAAINLMGVHHSEIRRGHELVQPGYLRATRLMSVRLHVLPESPWPVRHRSRMRLYLGTQEVMAGVRLLSGSSVEQGDSAYAQLVLAEPAIASGGQAFVLRAESPLITVGGGNVLQPAPPRIWRRRRVDPNRLAALHDEDPSVRIGAAVFLQGTAEWTTLDVARDADVSPGRVQTLLDELATAGVLVEMTTGPDRSTFLHVDLLADLEQRVLHAVRLLHEQAPLESAVPRQRIISRLEATTGKALLSEIITRLTQNGQLIGDERAVAHADYKPTLTAAQTRLLNHAIEAFRTAGFMPPDMAELARSAETSEGEMRMIIDLGVKAGHLVHIGGRSYLHSETESELRRRLTERLAGEDGLTMSQIRDLLGTSRKYALPMCEYLDRIGVTRRVDDLRVLADR